MRQRIAILLLCALCAGLALWLHNGSPQAQPPAPSPHQPLAPATESLEVNSARLPLSKG